MKIRLTTLIISLIIISIIRANTIIEDSITRNRVPQTEQYTEMKMKKKKIFIERSDGGKMKILVYSPKKNDVNTQESASNADNKNLNSQADSTINNATGVLWIHGGGYVTGMASMAGIMGRAPSLVKKYGAVVVSPEYRLGKKGRYPNALNDCYDALKYMVSHAEELGINPNQIFVCGESAGGGLAIAICMLARDKQEVNIAFQMPLYPMIDDRDTESSRDNHDKVWNTKRNHYGWKKYLGPLYGTDSVPVYAAPARQTDYKNLPPAYTFICTDEPFYKETIDYISALKAADIDAKIDIYQGMYHAFDMLSPRKKTSRIAILNFEAAFIDAQKKYFKNNR